MKIAFIIATLDSGGAERVLVSLANELCKKHEIKIIKFNQAKSFYPLDKSICVSSLPPFKFTNLYHKIASRFKKFFALRKAMKESKADVFISFLDTTNIACIASSFGLKTPLIISEHSTQSYLKPKIWRLLRRLTYPYANALSVLGQNDKIYYEKFVKNVQVIPNPCHFSPQTKELKKENLVLFIGRLDTNKNPYMFLKAISHLNKNLQESYEFIVAGDGILKEELMEFAKKLKIKVSFLGRVEDTQSLYERAKILCLCSFIEGLPTVLIESLFFKVARISTTYTNGYKDLIEDQKDGLLVPQNDDKALAEKLNLLMCDESLRVKIADEAFKRCKDFESQSVAEKWLDFIQKVAK